MSNYKTPLANIQLPKENEVQELKSRCPLPVLLRQMRLEQYAKSSCKSPLRKEDKPSWGIYERDRHHFWKDHGTGDHGDEITFLSSYLGLDAKTDFKGLLKVYRHFAKGVDGAPVKTTTTQPQKPNREGYGKGSEDQLSRLSSLRGIDIAALKLAQDRGLLVFGVWHGNEVFGITDKSGNVLEVRRLDGALFPSANQLNERKSHAIKGSNKSWPVGILEAQDCPMIVLTEGIPDLLAAFQVIMVEGVENQVAPVSMLSASGRISEEALPYFKGKHVRIIPHLDKPGQEAGQKWSAQLKAAGANKVDYIDLAAIRASEQQKDLCDVLEQHKLGFNGQENRRFLQ